MTLEGWANHNDEQDDFGKSPIIKKQAYQKACKNTLNNLSEGLSPSKRFSADKGLMLDISVNNNEKIPEGIREYKEDEVIKESIENNFFDKSIEVTGSKVQSKLQWPFKGRVIC